MARYPGDSFIVVSFNVVSVLALGNRLRQIRRKLLWAVAIAILLLGGVAVGVYVWLTTDSADPIDIADVVEDFRVDATPSIATTTTDRAAVSPATSGATTTAPNREIALPAIGVYVYDTEGAESVDALDGSAHRYPPESTYTITTGTDGCVRSRWDVLRQRWDEETHCRDGDGWRLETKTVFHSFFRQSERREFACDRGSVYLPASTASDTPFTASCSSTGGDQSGRSTEKITGRIVGVESLDVDGEEVNVVHVRYDMTIGGESEGLARVDRWISLETPPLLVREVRDGRTTSNTVIGDVHYEERYELMLRSLEPLR